MKLSGRYRENADIPDTAWLRPRDIYRAWPEITPGLLRKWRLAGVISGRRFRQDHSTHPFYSAREIKRELGLSLSTQRPKNIAQTIFSPLLRLKDLVHIGLSRDEIEILVKRGQIKPFHKSADAKSLYRTWHFNRLCRGLRLQIRAAPTKRMLPRREVVKWLGVPPAEIESWVPKWINRRAGDYDRDQIKLKILGMKTSRRKIASRTWN